MPRPRISEDERKALIRERARLCERRRKQRIKSDPVKREELLQKDRERYARKKAAGLIVSRSQMDPHSRQILRKRNKILARAFRQRKKEFARNTEDDEKSDEQPASAEVLNFERVEVHNLRLNTRKKAEASNYCEKGDIFGNIQISVPVSVKSESSESPQEIDGRMSTDQCASDQLRPDSPIDQCGSDQSRPCSRAASIASNSKSKSTVNREPTRLQRRTKAEADLQRSLFEMEEEKLKLERQKVTELSGIRIALNKLVTIMEKSHEKILGA